MAAIDGYRLAAAGETGLIVGGREFMNSLDDSSMAEIKAAIASEPWLAAGYDVGEKYIRTNSALPGRIDFDFIGLSRNVSSVKSKAKIHRFWVDEAESVQESSWEKLTPSVRENNSEVWVTWNPERKASATNKRFKLNPPANSKIVELNYTDNPWFPVVLEQERREDLEKRPDQYAHIWLGDYKTVVEGAYFASQLALAKEEGRIGKVSASTLLPVRLVADIGGTGRLSDSFVFWAVQFVGREIRWLNFYEAQGQEIGHHLSWLRSQKYTPGNAEIVLPHDGVKPGDVYNISYASAFREAGYSVTVIPNQGPGAALLRVEAMRKHFPAMWFDEEKTEGGREALAFYHSKLDANRPGIDLGPEHDWSSHAADAAGMGAVIYDPPPARDTSDSYSRSSGISASSWMTS